MKEAAVVIAFHHQNVLAVIRPEGGFALPGGTVEPGEDPSFTARRELFEETGLMAPAVAPIAMQESGKTLVHAYYAPNVYGSLRSSEEGFASFVPMSAVIDGPYGATAKQFFFSLNMLSSLTAKPVSMGIWQQRFAVN